MLLGTLALYLGANFYIFLRLVQAMGALPVWLRVVFGVLYWLAACGMFASFGLRNATMPESLHRVIYVVGTSWLLFTFYMAVVLLVADVVQHLRLSTTFKDTPQRTDFQIEGQPFHYRITQSFSWLYSMSQKVYIHFLL
jgi:hypothetical protein